MIKTANFSAGKEYRLFYSPLVTGKKRQKNGLLTAAMAFKQLPVDNDNIKKSSPVLL